MSEEFASQLNEMEERWQQKWEEEGVHRPDPDEDKEKFYLTAAYTYPSGGMHMGHVRSFAIPDVIARYKRMDGFNVLYPMGWHVTGTPVVGALQRLKEGEEEQLELLKDTYNVPEEDLSSFEEPMDFANYFIENSYKPNMQGLGLSIDWRREMNTSEESYNRFISWQYRKLREKGLLKKGKHPTKYDIKSENPVTTHDLLEGEEAEKQEYALVKFEGEDHKFPCATLRPETVFGVTHLLINPAESYKIAEVDGEEWVISEESVEKLRHQEKEVRVLSTVKGEEFVGEEVYNPVNEDRVMVLPAKFVDPDSGSGVVMSVPAHAPYDYISLKDLQQDQETLVEYGIEPSKVRKIEPKQIINVDGYSGFPAEEACREHDVGSQEDEEALEKATDDVYEKEFHTGVLNARCGQFENQHISEVKERLIDTYEEEGYFSNMWDFSEEVVSRSGGKVIVSLQESWFIEYGDKGWKDAAHKNLDGLEVYPEERRDDYNHAIDWLESWPCIRNYGLGTRLPFDEDFVIEPLSDSTIYMAFYTIRNIIEDVEPSKLKDEFFDFVYNGEGTAEEVAEYTGIGLETVEEARESFKYWYPMDFRMSGHDLIQNHLTFMMYHHTALFDERDWPKGICTNGMVLKEGDKMSSSKGNVVLPDEAMEQYGADTVRLFMYISSEPWQDFDWRDDEVRNFRSKLEAFHERSIEMYDSGTERQMNDLDRYVLSRLQKIKKETREALEGFQTRKAGLNAFFQLNSLMNTYRSRASEHNKGVVNDLIETQIKLLAPFTPHVCEELWEEIGMDGFVAEAEWPEPVEELRDEEVEKAQELVESTIEDIRELEDIVDEYDEIKVIVASAWKRELFEELSDTVEERPEFGEAMDELTDGRERHAEKIKDYLQRYMEEPGELPSKIFSEEREKEILEENQEFIENEFDSWVKLELESESSEDKAERAEPGKPAIVMG